MRPPVHLKTLLDLESRKAFTTCRMNHLPDPYRCRTKLAFAQDGLSIDPLIGIWPSMNDGKVLLRNLATLENDAKLARRAEQAAVLG